MTARSGTVLLDERVEQWRDQLRRRQAVRAGDLAQLELRLRDQMVLLGSAGLSADEAFMVAAKRVAPPEAAGAHARAGALAAFAVAIATAVAVKTPGLLGFSFDEMGGFYQRNLGLFVLPLLAGYFAWRRRLDARSVGSLAAGFVSAAVAVNVYRFVPGGSTAPLAGLHLPIALWLLVGIAYAGGRWREVTGRMDFIRFSGELFIYYVLIALGGGVLTAIMMMLFQTIGIDMEPIFESWLLPCGAAGGVVIASWLADAKQNVIENIAPVLTRLFTPFFAAVLVAYLGTLLWTGGGVNVEREVLIGFDLLLIVVLGLLVYSVSARDPQSPPEAFDLLQIVLVVSALLADLVALWSIGERIAEYGLSPNRAAGLGMNLVLLVNLAWSAVLYLRFVRGHGSFAALERWQTGYLIVYAAWAAVVVMLFPPLFGFA